MRATLRRLFIALLILAALVGVAYQSRYKIHLADFTWRKFIEIVGQANVLLLLISFVAIYGCYAIRAIRWQRFCRYLGPTTFLNTYGGTLMGFASIFVLGRAGEPVRPLLLARKDRLPVSSMFGIFFLERFFDFAAAVALACLSLLVFPNRLSDAGADMNWVGNARHGAWLLLGAMTALIVIMVYHRVHGASAVDRRLDSWRTAGGMRLHIASAISGISEGLQAIRTFPDLWAAIGYTAAHWTLAVLIYLWVSQAFSVAFVHSNMNFSGAMLLLAVTLVGSVLQLPGIGGGAQIASIVALTAIFGIEQEPAIAIAVVLWIITFAGCTLAGIPLLIHEGMSVGELRQLARAEAEAEEVGKHIAVSAVNGVAISEGLERKNTRRFIPVRCPFCSVTEDKVIDSREGRAGDLIRRRRECLKCGRRFTTYERIDEIPYMVIKKDGRRERFDRQKILQGLLKSCEKRPVPTAKLEALVDEVERFVHEAPERERKTSEIGELLMNRVKKLDKVAYVRFASVYLDFKDVKEFMSELKGLLKDRSRK